MADSREPQSYGSQQDWSSGKVGEEVNRQKSEPGVQHAGFYESRRDSEGSDAHQGGDVSPVQLADVEGPSYGMTSAQDDPVKNVTSTFSGAKRSGYFRDRDYK